jgi:dCTP deaminase
MSLLSYPELVKLVDQGVISGLASMDQINASSIDIRLGNEILVEQNPALLGKPSVIALRDRTPLAMQRIDIAGGFYDIRPGEAILAATVERFDLPSTNSCEYLLKSSMARIFLEHLHAGWADSGFNNSVLTLELVNCSQYHTIRLHPGDFVGQIRFFRHDEVPIERSYATIGRYNNCDTVEHIKP